MQIIINVRTVEAEDAIVDFSRRAYDATDGNVSWLDVIAQTVARATGAPVEGLQVKIK